MNTDSKQIVDDCPRLEIAEYIDGELSPRVEFDLELHFANCRVCTDELNALKEVSNTLEILLEDKKEEIVLPENFTKVITANAESNLEGVRSPKERSRALLISLMLIFMLLFGFGTKGESVLIVINKFADQFLAVCGFVLHLFYTVAIGVSTVFGALFSKFVFTSTFTIFGLITAFVIISLILSKMVFRFNRT